MALKNYGNGIMASSDDLASIGEAFLREEMERQRQRALLRAAFRDGKQVDGPVSYTHLTLPTNREV